MGSRGSDYERRRRRERENENTAEEENTSAVNNQELTERMNNAFYAKSGKEADSKLLPGTQEAWGKLTDEEKIAIRSYTGKLAGELNTFLWTGNEQHGGYDNITDTYYDGDVQNPLDTLTNALNKSELKQDTWLERGISTTDLYTMLGVSNLNGIDDIIDSGEIKTHLGFMSTTSGDISGSLAKNDNVLLKIFAPKGTKGMYINPVSRFGDKLLKIGADNIVAGYGKIKKRSKIEQDWDGKTSYASGVEIETLLQRGQNFKVMGYENKSGKLEVTIVIIP